MAPRRYIASETNSTISRPAPNRSATKKPSTQIDCVATVAITQPPLIPASSDGLFSCVTTAAKKAYMTTTQRTTPSAHSNLVRIVADEVTMRQDPLLRDLVA